LFIVRKIKPLQVVSILHGRRDVKGTQAAVILGKQKSRQRWRLLFLGES